MQTGSKSDRGKRRLHNEDAFLICKDINFFVVADGVGGGKAGEFASEAAVKGLAGFMRKNLGVIETAESLEDMMFEGLRQANNKILEISETDEKRHGMATTLVAALIKENILILMNVGDSRGYLFRDGRILQITEDHTYVNSLVRAGMITRAEAKTHEDKHMITRAVGAEKKIKADFFSLELKKDDTIILCTDGLTGELDDSEIGKILAKNDDMDKAAEELINEANRKGGRDNVTAVLIKITEGSN